MVLYLAVHDTRYVTVKLNIKDNSEIITTFFRHYIFRTSLFVFTLNRLEFNNQYFCDMVYNLNTVIWTTATQILMISIKLTIFLRNFEEYYRISMNVALVWNANAKNTLHKVKEYNHNKLVFKRNTNLPTDYQLHLQTKSGLIIWIHSLIKSFLKCELSEKMRCTFHKQVKENKWKKISERKPITVWKNNRKECNCWRVSDTLNSKGTCQT